MSESGNGEIVWWVVAIDITSKVGTRSESESLPVWGKLS